MSHKKKIHAAAPPLPARLKEELEIVSDLLRRQQWEEACNLLEPLEKRYPRRVEVLEPLSRAYRARSIWHRWCEVTEQLLLAQPGDATLLFDLAARLHSEGFFALSLRWWRRFLEIHPTHERAAQAAERCRETARSASSFIGSLRLTIQGGTSDAEVEELAACHDEALLRVRQNHPNEGRRLERLVLERVPHWAPAHVHMAWCEWSLERIPAALAAIEKALALQPDALSVLARAAIIYRLTGHLEQAREALAHLRTRPMTLRVEADDKAEAASIIGDYEAVLEVLDEARTANLLPEPGQNPIVWQLAGEAAFRLERFDEAREYWERAVELSPQQIAASQAASSLGEWAKHSTTEDCSVPPESCDVPWPTFVYSVLPSGMFSEWLNIWMTNLENMMKTGYSIRNDTRSFVRHHPTLEHLVPFFLERGDVIMRVFAIETANGSCSPTMLNALRDFALSRNGADKDRLSAAQHACEGGLLPSRLTKIWWKGDWREMPLAKAMLHRDPPRHFSPPLEKELNAARLAMDDERWEDAAPILERLCAREPKIADFKLHLAWTYENQGRTAQSEELLRQVVEARPGYALARLRLANLAIAGGRYEEARALFVPLWDAERLHFDEILLWCRCEATLALEEDKPALVQSWLDWWKHLDSKDETMLALRVRAGLDPADAAE